MVEDDHFAPGDVVLVPFPFTDQSGGKKRPAIVVSSRAYNQQRRDIVIMAVTSQVRSPLGFAEALVSDWQAAGLLKPSLFKPVWTTIERTLVLRKMGTLSAADGVTLARLVRQVIDSESP